MTRSSSKAPGSDRILEEYLVLSAQGGSRVALDALVRRFHRRLVAHAWRLLGTRELAEEAVQSAWIDIIRGLKGLRDERVFPAWAFRIVTCQANKRIGRIIGERTAIAASDLAPDSEVPPDQPGSPGLARAIGALPHGQRAAIALHYYEDLSIAEVAVALDVPAGTVKTRLMHARLRLKAALEGSEP